jgi:hypothetical protein
MLANIPGTTLIRRIETMETDKIQEPIPFMERLIAILNSDLEKIMRDHY